MSTPSDRRPSLQFVFLFGHMANDWCPAAIWLLIPAIGLALDLQPSQLGLLIGIHAFGAALAYFPAGFSNCQSCDRLMCLGIYEL